MKIASVSLGLLASAFGLFWTGGAMATTVSASLVAGSVCDGPSSAVFEPGGAEQSISLCVSSDLPMCGYSAILKSASTGENDRFRVINRTLLGSIMLDPNTAYPAYPVGIVDTGTPDFGATVNYPAPEPAAKQLAVAVFVIAPQVFATAERYTISLSIPSNITTTTTDCFTPRSFGDNLVSPSFTFLRRPAATDVRRNRIRSR
ncbi:MAG: hypothetical protein ABI854_10370 [Betaproteobacteria bacterium]